jgi:hypothetical protein
MTANAAIKRRLEIEGILIHKYEGQEIEGSYDGERYLHGNVRTIGVDWIGGDEFEVIINLEGRRYIIDYEDFLINTKVI